MLSKRLIACLDVRNGCVVKGVQFEGLRNAGDPAALARRYNVEGIDELVILDVTATLESRQALAETIRAVSRELFIPLAVGGGIRSLDDAEAAIEAGADKVSINSAALVDPELITRLAARYGSQAIVVAIDAKRADGRFDVYSRSGSTVTAQAGGRVGAGGRVARRRRDPADLDRPRRHARRIRLRAQRRGVLRRLNPGDCLRRRRHLSTLSRRVHGG